MMNNNSETNNSDDSDDSDDDAINTVDYTNIIFKETYLPWSRVKCYDELLSVNLDFIHGKLSHTPYHFGSLVEPSDILIQNLDSLHRYGILTVNGHESICKYGNKNAWSDRYFDYEQRGYLDFHIDLDTFADNNDNNLVNLFIKKIKETNLTYRIGNIKTGYSESNIIDSNGKYNIGRHRKHKNAELVASSPWINGSNMNLNIKPKYCLWHDGDHAFKPNQILRNTIYFSVALPEYGNGVIEQILIDICKNIGVKTHDILNTY